jgi:hypothetical protein
MGDHPERLVSLVERGRPAAVIANAIDYGSENVLDYVIVPHVDSPDHPETERCAAVADRLRADGVPHRTLRDGQAIVVDGSAVSVR